MIVLFAGVRALHFLSLTVLFGSGFFEADLRKNIPGLAVDGRRVCRIAALVALVTALLWLSLTAGQMSGDWSRSLDPQTILAVLTTTRFGTAFLVRLAFLLVLACLCILNGGALWRTLVAGSALATIALSGHAAASGPPQFGFVGATNDAVHLLAAGFWIGGLALLIPLLAGKANCGFLLPMLALFSSRGMIAVALLVMTGIINALTILLSGPGRPAMVYLLLLGIKVLLALGMIALATFNRFRLMPLVPQDTGRLRANIIAELALGIAILILVGFLGLLPPTL